MDAKDGPVMKVGWSIVVVCNNTDEYHSEAILSTAFGKSARVRCLDRSVAIQLAGLGAFH